jgi:DNA-binding NtrC family response regulator
MARILIVDDEELLRDLVSDTLSMQGHECFTAGSGSEGLEKMDICQPDLIMSDYKMPRMTGLEFLLEVKKKKPEQSFVIMTAYGTIGTAVEAMQAGADHFIEKPVDPDMLDQVVAKALEKDAMRKENKALRKQLSNRHSFIGHGDNYQDLYKLVEEVAPSKATVLILGESGVGKEVLARSVHNNSDRAFGSFVKINCAALPDSLIESELFGHEKGAFTGALKTKKGKFELAHGGTLLLDEIGEMPMAAQAKLLRVLQEKEVIRVGGDEEIAVDVRVVCTTNRNLEEEVKEGRFREDLFYRLNVIPVTIPPLRERKEDIPYLVRFFIERFNDENGYSVEDADESVWSLLQNYDWPGNIRQLENAVERAMVFAKTANLHEEHFDLLPGSHATTQKEGVSVQESGVDELALELRPGMKISEAEQSLILKTLEACDGNKNKASEMLDISIRTLRNKLHEYGAFEGYRQRNSE